MYIFSSYWETSRPTTDCVLRTSITGKRSPPSQAAAWSLSSWLALVWRPASSTARRRRLPPQAAACPAGSRLRLPHATAGRLKLVIVYLVLRNLLFLYRVRYSLVPEKFEFQVRICPALDPLTFPLPPLGPSHLHCTWSWGSFPGGRGKPVTRFPWRLFPLRRFEDWFRGNDGCDPQLAVVLSLCYLSFKNAPCKTLKIMKTKYA